MEPTATPEEEFDALASALKGLSHPKRLRALRFLTEPHSLEELASELRVARQSAQEHLDQLLALGLVEARASRGAHGPVTHYVVAIQRLFDVYDRLGSRLGILASELEETVRTFHPTAPLAGSTHAPRADGARLTLVHGMRVGQTIPLSGNGPWLIGRDPAATLCLDYDPYVSQRHAEVRRGPKGYELADALSSNGTYFDWHRIPRGGIVTLSNGSLLRIGKTLILFRLG